MQWMSEKMQSAQEELETSKEELQSANEELDRVNRELKTKIADLSRSNNDMINLLACTGIGTVFVDAQLRIQGFTPAIRQVINLIPTDVGRPLAHIACNLVEYDRLEMDVQSVLDSLDPVEIEVQTRAGAWHLLRIRPYRTVENAVEGAVVSFIEFTEMKKARIALQESYALRRASNSR
jgi:two-component system CheB/CheR fusion protein